MHWAVKYIGSKYAQGGRGPDVFDCWGLLSFVYAREFGIPLPDLPGITVADALTLHRTFCVHETDWKCLDAPEDGCVVAMSQKTAIHHVGIYADVDGGRVIHCWKEHGTVADSLRGIAWKGFRTVIFYRHQLWPL